MFLSQTPPIPARSGEFGVASIAVYSMKGGVGKTTLAVNLAWLAAAQSARRTLLWDLDGQAGASFILIGDRQGRYAASEVIEGDVDPSKLIQETAQPGLHLLPADSSLRMLDSTFAAIDRKKHLRRILEGNLSPDWPETPRWQA